MAVHEYSQSPGGTRRRTPRYSSWNPCYLYNVVPSIHPVQHLVYAVQNTRHMLRKSSSQPLFCLDFDREPRVGSFEVYVEVDSYDHLTGEVVQRLALAASKLQDKYNPHPQPHI